MYFKSEQQQEKQRRFITGIFFFFLQVDEPITGERGLINGELITGILR